MASLEEQQPKRVRARTQRLQRTQERSALAGSALGGRAAGRTLQAWLWVWRCERSEVVRIDGREDWVRRRQCHPACGSGRSGKPAEQSGQGCSGPGRAGRCPWLTVRQSTHRPAHPQGSTGGSQRTESISGCLSLWLFLQSSLPVSQEVSLIQFPREAV